MLQSPHHPRSPSFISAGAEPEAHYCTCCKENPAPGTSALLPSAPGASRPSHFVPPGTSAPTPPRQSHGPCLPTLLQPELAQPGAPQRGAVALLTRAVVVEVREENLRHPEPELIRPATGRRRQRQSSGSSAARAVSACRTRVHLRFTWRGGLSFGEPAWAALPPGALPSIPRAEVRKMFI